MSLDSSAAHTEARKGDKRDDSNTTLGAEVKIRPFAKDATLWHYLFVHHMKLDWVNERLSQRFTTFVHRTAVYKRGDRSGEKVEQPTIAGLLFVQGVSRDIEDFLNIHVDGLHLVKDCSTWRVACITDEVMQRFMQISRVSPTSIRFLARPINYYSEGHPMVRITSGPLAGMEGYRIRIARDKCLVTGFGGMTVAIGGIHKESFENPGEYVRQRRAEIGEGVACMCDLSTPTQKAIDACFFTPQTQLDVLALVRHVEPWVDKARTALYQKNFDLAVEISLFLLEEFGSRFAQTCVQTDIDNLREMQELVCAADSVLLSILSLPAVSVDLRQRVQAERTSLVLRFPHLQLVM